MFGSENSAYLVCSVARELYSDPPGTWVRTNWWRSAAKCTSGDTTERTGSATRTSRIAQSYGTPPRPGSADARPGMRGSIQNCMLNATVHLTYSTTIVTILLVVWWNSYSLFVSLNDTCCVSDTNRRP